MPRLVSGLFVALLSVVAVAQEPIGAPKPQIGTLVREDWQSASIDGVRAGYVQFTVHEHNSNGIKFLRASRKLSLTLKRFGDIAKIDAMTGTDEMADGPVLGVFMRQALGKDVNLTVRGVVKDNQLHVTAEGKMQPQRVVAWDPKVIGSLGELKLVSRLKPQPGTSFEYIIYEPIINSLVHVKATTEAYEEIAVGGKKYNLLRIVAQPQRVADVTLPPSTFWFDANYEMIRSATTMPGLGKLLLERTTREDALKPCLGPDLGWRQAIQLKQQLAAPHDSAVITYKMILKNDADPATIFARDDRQSVKLTGNKGEIELIIQAIRKPPAQTVSAKDPGVEFITNNNFISSDDELVKRHAFAAIGRETDPWKKAQMIERWVHTNMKVLNFTEAMAPASQVAKSLEGDCTEYSMLCAAMCRAAGVPSRTALGLVYVPAQDTRQPVFAMHMWTEVWVNGQWLGLDATLGRGSIGAAHIKVTDHSWSGVATMTPLMPLMRVMMSEPAVTIVSEQRTK